MTGSETELEKLGGLGWIVLPIVVCGKQAAAAITKLKNWIGEEIRNAMLAQTWSNATDNNLQGAGSIDDESADHHVIAGLDPHSGRKV